MSTLIGHWPLKQNSTASQGPTACYPVEAPQEFDEPGKELDPDAQVWKTYVREADQVDEEMVDGWNKSMDVILIFAALFSAISTAFVIESYKNLKQDPADTSSQALLTISQTLILIANGSQPSSSTPISDPETPVFRASAKDICVNVLWFLSLSLSVAVSLISMLAKEWCLEFMSGRTGPPGAQARRRQQRWDGLVRWRMKGVITMLPSLIHLSLLLFAIGLCVFLWGVHFGVAIPVIVVTTIAAGAYFACTIVPFIYDFCPYGTVLSRIIKDWTTIRAKLNQENPPQDGVTARALQWMITTCETPRSVDVALQSLAAAHEDLPFDELERVNAWGLIKQRLEHTDVSKQLEQAQGAGALYKRAIGAHLRRNFDMNPQLSDETQRLIHLVVGVQSTINGLIHEALSSSRSLDQGAKQILKRCTRIGFHYLSSGILKDQAFYSYDVDPENLVKELVQLLERYLMSEEDLDPVLYNALAASFAFVMCCNVARGVTEQSENIEHVLRLVRDFAADRRAVFSLSPELLSVNLTLGSLWLSISANYSDPLLPVPPPHALLEIVLEALWAGLMSTIYSDQSALKRCDPTRLAHGMLYLLAHPHTSRLTIQDCNFINRIILYSLGIKGQTKIQHGHHAQYIQDINHNLTTIPNITAFTPQLLLALDTLGAYSPWDDGYILPTSTIYMFVVKFLCLTSDMGAPDSYRACGILGWSPIPKCSLQLVQQLLADNIITDFTNALNSDDVNKQAFATAQLLVFLNMSIHEPDRSSPALSILEQALLEFPGLDGNLERQDHICGELEIKLELLLDQHNNEINGNLRCYAYRVLEVVLQRRYAPLSERAHDNLSLLPNRLREISSCVNLEAEWLVVYPGVCETLESEAPTKSTSM